MYAKCRTASSCQVTPHKDWNQEEAAGLAPPKAADYAHSCLSQVRRPVASLEFVLKNAQQCLTFNETTH